MSGGAVQGPLANRIGRVTTSGAFQEFPIPTSQSGPVDIAAGPDEALWFTEQDGNKIGRITTAGAVEEFPIPTLASNPSGIVAGPDGALWFTELSGDKIGRIAPPAPTSTDQCKHGGWRAFGFRNQGQCVASVRRGPKP